MRGLREGKWPGEIIIFDRTWYNRVGVKYGWGFAPAAAVPNGIPLRFAVERLARYLELLLLFRIDFRVREVEFCNVFHDRGRD